MFGATSSKTVALVAVCVLSTALWLVMYFSHKTCTASLEQAVPPAVQCSNAVPPPSQVCKTWQKSKHLFPASKKRSQGTGSKYDCADQSICMMRGVPDGYNHLLPRAFIVGFPKCSSTALGWLIDMNPMVHVLNEMRYFVTKKLYGAGLGTYCNMVDICVPPGAVLVDKSPQYVTNTGTSVVNRIHAYDPLAKIIVVVREPVDHMLSYLAHFYGEKSWQQHKHRVLKRNGAVNPAESAIKQSIYIRSLQNWMRKFPVNDSLLVIDSNDVTHHPHDVIRRVEEFLGVPHLVDPDWVYYDEQRGFHCKYIDKPRNITECLGTDHSSKSYKGWKHAKIPNTTLPIFKNYFKPSNEDLFDAIGQRFDWD